MRLRSGEEGGDPLAQLGDHGVEGRRRRRRAPGRGSTSAASRDRGSSSSWARSQTVTTRGGSVATASSGRGRARPRRSSCRWAAFTAPGSTAAAGWVPAEPAGRPVASRHSAAASWERAELAVQTNRASPSSTGRDGASPSRASTRRLHVAAAAVAARARPLDQARPARARRGGGRAGSTRCRAGGTARREPGRRR